MTAHIRLILGLSSLVVLVQIAVILAVLRARQVIAGQTVKRRLFELKFLDLMDRRSQLKFCDLMDRRSQVERRAFWNRRAPSNVYENSVDNTASVPAAKAETQ